MHTKNQEIQEEAQWVGPLVPGVDLPLTQAVGLSASESHHNQRRVARVCMSTL